MKVPLSALVLVLSVGAAMTAPPTVRSLQRQINQLTKTVTKLTKTVTELTEAVSETEYLKKAITDLSRQTMQQQFSAEELARTDADSGIKVIRSRRNGLKNYDSPSHVGGGVNAIHDHSNYQRTIGMGEVSVLMNGVSFRTRHNDYKLVTPSTSSTGFRDTENIALPEVPPTVVGTIEEKVEEMTEWFKAFKTQNSTVRDYRKYFKPVLCYLEGTWTLDKELQEPFSSDRHQIDASSWFDLQEKIMFTSYTGSKSNKENLAYLPTSILSVNDTTGIANYAQWNYRILCKPLSRDVPLSMFKYVDDLAYRMRDGKTVEQTLETRAARFKLYDENKSDRYQILDEIFSEVPGMDNIPDNNLTQATLGDSTLLDVTSEDTNVPLKTGFYHRQYKFHKNGAMGFSVNPRGFNDENMWVAQTTQRRVAPISLKTCKRRKARTGKNKNCSYIVNRFSYALPLEIIFLTPLLSWNPYNFEIHDDFKSAAASGGNGRNKPYNGVDLSHYFMTPYELFAKKRGNTRDPADTSRGVVEVLDKDGKARQVVASGTSILLREIPDVGSVRLRFPIAPVANEGSSVWEELTALKDLVFNMKDKLNMSSTGPGSSGDMEPDEVFFQMSTTTNDPPGEHYHEIAVPYTLYKKRLMKGKAITVESDQHQGHTHTLRMKYDVDTKTFEYTKCDLKKYCFDGHPKQISLITRNSYTMQ